MALTNLERLRLQIADRRRLVMHEVAGVSDGQSKGYQVRGIPVFSGTLSVVLSLDGVVTILAEGIDFTFDYALGLLILNTAAGSGAFIQCSYQWATFSDAELNDVLLQSGFESLGNDDVTKASILALQMVLADGDRFIKYTLGQEMVDRSQARQAIVDLIAQLQGNALSGLVGIVEANSVYRECLMSPYLEQNCD